MAITREQALLEMNQSVRGRATPQRPGRSKQDFGTPPEFIAAVEKRFGSIGWDLAASFSNAITGSGQCARCRGRGIVAGDQECVVDVCPACDGVGMQPKHYFDESDDALTRSWALPGVRVAWLNPPFGDIRPWAAKCESVRNLPRWTLMLVPASIGSGWWRDHVLGKCQADGIPRLKFVGADSMYPKDLALLAYGYGVSGSGYWDWRELVGASK